jgi:hypothetical protein
MRGILFGGGMEQNGLTKRQKALLDELQRCHAVGFHPSPRTLAARIGYFGDKAVRSELMALFIEGHITQIYRGIGSRSTRYILKGCTCEVCDF